MAPWLLLRVRHHAWHACVQVEGESLPVDALSELRIGLKLRGGLPDALPENLRNTVVLWLQAEQPQVCGCMRSGCVFVTLSVVLRQHERERAIGRGALSLLRAILGSDSRWEDKHLTVQIEDSIAYSQVRSASAAPHPSQSLPSPWCVLLWRRPKRHPCDAWGPRTAPSASVEHMVRC